MKPLTNIVLALACLACASLHAQKFPNLALTPPMGWNSWNKFQCDVTEDLIRQTADAMATNGMKEAGYQYVNIDDCWHGVRDAQGFMQPDTNRFPSGIKALADYVHSKGLKLGIYSDVGNQTCGGRPGSRGHEYQDALTYASWGIDYLKYDWCNAEGLKAEGAYATMRDAIHAAGRPMIFSMCEWGQNKPWLWASNTSHLWRTTTDIYPSFAGTLDHTNWQQWGVLRIIDAQKPLRTYAGPGHWNDPDMLEVGNGLTANEDRAHFSMWCMLAAPLISGNDLRSMSPAVKAVLVNKDVIVINQDALGVQGFAYSTNKNVEIWFKPLANGDWAMCALNRGKDAQKISFDWKNEKVSDSFSRRDAEFAVTTYDLKNLWTKESAGTTKDILSAEIPGHDVLLLRLKNVSAASTTPETRPVIRIKAGATKPFIDADGNVWEADRGFADGDMVSRDENLLIANTKNPALYRSEHYGMTAFSVPLANGRYTIKLHFAETFGAIDGPGRRVFSFNVAGHEFKDFDLFAMAGGSQRAYVESADVDITGGKLDITFTPNMENPELNGIEIIPLP
ncbi:MAG: malectin domain-containing carbohydrate-binding protein [Limisphaerales bacterium]